jgi:hypothetical protein
MTDFVNASLNAALRINLALRGYRGKISSNELSFNHCNEQKPNAVAE